MSTARLFTLAPSKAPLPGVALELIDEVQSVCGWVSDLLPSPSLLRIALSMIPHHPSSSFILHLPHPLAPALLPLPSLSCPSPSSLFPFSNPLKQPLPLLVQVPHVRPPCIALYQLCLSIPFLFLNLFLSFLINLSSSILSHLCSFLTGNTY